MFTNDSRFALVPASVKTAITNALQANEETFVLRDVYEWLGYSRLDAAVRQFENAGFLEGSDFHRTVEFSGARERQDIHMTSDCFKAFAMQARTERGKQVRLYYIECERQYSKLLREKQVPKSLSQEEMMAIAYESYKRERALYKSNQPGLISYFENVVSDSKALEPECKSAKEIVEDAGYEFSTGHLCSFGRYLTSVYVQMHGREPKQKLENGRMVNCYPHYMWEAVDTYANRA